MIESLVALLVLVVATSPIWVPAAALLYLLVWAFRSMRGPAQRKEDFEP